MNKVVLKSVSAENFASFADSVLFTTEADLSKKEYMDNTFEVSDGHYNKVSFLYGANGSGKTYFCKVLREIQRLLVLSPIIMSADASSLLRSPELKELNAPVKCFAFDSAYVARPTKFAIDIVIDKITYHYEFAIQGREIVYELLTKKYRRTEKIIERTSSAYKDITLRSDLKEFDVAKKVVKEEALCLPVAAMLNNPLAFQIVEAIRDITVVNMATGRLAPLNPKKSFSEDRLEKYLKIIQKADPTIRDIKVSFEEEEISSPKVETDDFENRKFIETRVGVDSSHAVYEKGHEVISSPISFFADESLGTIKLFTALPYLFDVLETGGVLIIDELENGLHLSLAKEIVQLFINEESNPHHAQLICTSHQPLLIDGNFRRDQVWITSKDTFGKSSIYRLSDLRLPRAKMNLANRILEGAFGCNPARFFENNT